MSDQYEGANELLESAWLIEWEEAAPIIADDPDEPDTLIWPDEEAAIDWAAWERDYETGEPFRRMDEDTASMASIVGEAIARVQAAERTAVARLVDEGFALSQRLFLLWAGVSFEDRVYRVFSKAARRALRRQELLDDAEPSGAGTAFLCPECGTALELLEADDDDGGPYRWTCEPCGIEYPASQFPVPDAAPSDAVQQREYDREDAGRD